MYLACKCGKCSFTPFRLNFVFVVLSIWFGGMTSHAYVFNHVVGGKQGHAPCETLLLYQSLFLVSVKFHGDHKTNKDVVLSGNPEFWGYFLISNGGVC